MSKFNDKKRGLIGQIAGFIGIAINLLLAIGKIIIGSVFGLISVLADGLNNLTDGGSSILSIVSFKLSSQPADKEHPYGHERVEYICSLSVAFLMLLVAFNTVKDSIGKIIAPDAITFSYWVIAILVASILLKAGLFVFYKIVAKKINSDILSATASDSLMDCVSTSVALITFIISFFTGFNADGYAGIVVSLFITWTGICILKSVFSNLIGKSLPTQMIDDIKQKIISYEGVLGVHDLSAHCYGPNKYFASVHIEVDAKVDVLISHELVDLIEKDFIEQLGITLTGHLDPITIDDERVNALKATTENIVTQIDPRFSIHDFRMVFGKDNTNVLFDLAIPYECSNQKEQIKAILEQKFADMEQNYRLVITIEPSL